MKRNNKEKELPPLNRIYQGHCLDFLKSLPDECIDMVVTSPPYCCLRDYGEMVSTVWDEDIGCNHKWNGNHGKGFCFTCNAWYGQLGLEPTIELYIKHLCDIFDEIKRVLKREGTCWVNMGDTYSGSSNGSNDYKTEKSKNYSNKEQYQEKYNGQKAGKTSLPDKCLLQIPSRFAIEMTNRGWILRNEIIWHKPNSLPSSVKDRFTVDFEKIFFFTRNKKYYFEPQYEPWGKDEREAGIVRARKYGYSGKGTYQDWYFNQREKRDWVAGNKNLKEGMLACRGKREMKPPLIHPLGRNKRCVWRVPTRPFKEAHFATFPEALIETPIKVGCPESGVVLDPFMGSGTVAVVARRLGRNFIGIELNPAYIEIALKRFKDAGFVE